MAHEVHNKKVQASNGQNHQDEVLQLYIKVGRHLKCYLISSTTKKYYTLDLGLINASKDRSILDLSTIQAPLKNPLRVFSKTPLQDVDLSPKNIYLLQNIDLESVADLI